MRYFNGRGFSVIELSVVLAITSILFMMVFLGYGKMQSKFDVQSAQLEMQANLKSGIDYLERDVRMAGFNGQCTQDPSGTTPPLPGTRHRSAWSSCDNGTVTGLMGPFGGYVTNNATWLDIRTTSSDWIEDGAISTSLDVKLDNDSNRNNADAVQIGRVEGKNLSIQSGGPGANIDTPKVTLQGDYSVVGGCIISPQGETLLCQDDVAVAQSPDCSTSNILQPTNINMTGQVIKLILPPRGPSLPCNDPPPEEDYTVLSGGSLASFVNLVYFIDPATATDGIPKLMRKYYRRAPEVLAEGIEDLQIQYVMEGDNTLYNDPYNYTKKGGTRTIYDVREVYITLIARTQLSGIEGEKFSTPISAANHTYVSPAADSYIRRAITSRIRVRNLHP